MLLKYTNEVGALAIHNIIKGGTTANFYYCFFKSEDLLDKSTSAISNFRHLKFYLVPSAFSLTSLINLFGISNSAISNFCYVKQFVRSLQLFLGCFPSAISNIRMRFSNESYSSFQAFEC